MPETFNRNIPYPTAAVGNNVPYDMQLLAEAVDAALGPAAGPTVLSPAGFTGDMTVERIGRTVSVQVDIDGTIATGQPVVAANIIPVGLRPPTISAFAGVWFDLGEGMAAIDTFGNLIVKNGTGAARSRLAATFTYFI